MLCAKFVWNWSSGILKVAMHFHYITSITPLEKEVVLLILSIQECLVMFGGQ